MKRLAVMAFVAVAGGAMAQTFTNGGATVNIPPSGTGGTSDANSTTLSTINVSGVGNSLTGITVDFFGLSGTFPDDLDAMLVAPNGDRIILMSDLGGGTDVTGVNLTFATGFTPLPDAAIVSGTYSPNNVGTGDTWHDGGGAVTPATSILLSDFLGDNPNGTWSLYIRDDAGADVHSLAGGWALNLTAVPEPTSMAILGLGAAALIRRRRK